MKKNSQHKKEYLAEDKIRVVLEREIVDPFIRSVCSDIDISIKLTAALYVTRYTEEVILKLLREENLKPARTKACTLYLGYFGKIYQSSLISLGSTDYLSSMILMRALFELLVGISTEENGSMRSRITSISFLDEKEKKSLTKTWDLLCAWSHPYSKWTKYLCPIAFGAGRIHNEDLFSQSVNYSQKILDFMLVSVFETLGLSRSHFADSPANFIYIELPMFQERLNKTNSSS